MPSVSKFAFFFFAFASLFSLSHVLADPVSDLADLIALAASYGPDADPAVLGAALYQAAGGDEALLGLLDSYLPPDVVEYIQYLINNNAGASPSLTNTPSSSVTQSVDASLAASALAPALLALAAPAAYLMF